MRLSEPLGAILGFQLPSAADRLSRTGRLRRLSGAALGLGLALALTPIAPANATISFGDLMYTDLFRWQGQDGALTWREILAKFDCTEELTFYLWNAPSPPPPVIIPATPAVDPVEPPSNVLAMVNTAPLTPPPVIVPPIVGVPTMVAADVPEPSTWAMLLLGFAGLGYAAGTGEQSGAPLRTFA